MRESGEIDLYCHMSRKETIKNLNNEIEDVDLTFSKFYFKQKNGKIKGFDHKNSSSITYQVAEEIPESQIKWEKIHIKKVQTMVKIFSGINVVNIGYCQARITHGKFVSIFRIDSLSWVMHVEYPSDVLFYFRHQGEAGGTRYQSIILKNGDVHLGLNLSDNKNSNLKGDLKLSGQGVRFSDNVENNDSMLLTLKKDNQYKLQILYRKVLHDVEQYQTAANNLSTAFVQIRGKTMSYFVVLNGKTLSLFSQKDQNNNPLITMEKELPFPEELKGCIHAATSYNINDHLILFD